MRPQYIIFVRHADSTKNQLTQFSNSSTDEQLTSTGTDEIFHLGNSLDAILRSGSLTGFQLLCAPSSRARLTASLLADRLKVNSDELPGFDSISAGPHAGLSETEVAARDPPFISALALYRAGLLSSYSMPLPQGAENVRSFEARIAASLRLIEDAPHQASIVVGHRSPITASLIHYARRASGYPNDFFGYVPLRTGYTSCVKLDDGKVTLLWVDALPSPEIAFYAPAP